jgi:hypothetical protein
MDSSSQCTCALTPNSFNESHASTAFDKTAPHSQTKQRAEPPTNASASAAAAALPARYRFFP